MAVAPSLESSPVLIARQLNILHLTPEIPGGGESVRASVETDHQSDQNNTDLVNRSEAEAGPVIKQEESSEEDTSNRGKTPTPSDIHNHEDTMMEPKHLERKARFRAQLESDDLIVIDEANLEDTRAQLKKDMEAERERFTGASTWAPAEERLFELLFMR